MFDFGHSEKDRETTERSRDNVVFHNNKKISGARKWQQIKYKIPIPVVFLLTLLLSWNGRQQFSTVKTASQVEHVFDDVSIKSPYDKMSILEVKDLHSLHCVYSCPSNIKIKTYCHYSKTDCSYGGWLSRLNSYNINRR